MKIKLKKPRNTSTASQCRQMGIEVGDTIIGRQKYSFPSGNWDEVKLTLIFLGKTEVVWKVIKRNKLSPKWRTHGESVDWKLDCREWWLIVKR